MKRLSISSGIILTVFVLSGILWAQVDTTLTITSEGNVGIGITAPETKLQVEGSVRLDKTGKSGRLILNTTRNNDPGRYGIRFTNNILGTFEGEDIGTQYFGFYAGWGAKRQHDAVIAIHGKAKNNWGNNLILTHNGTDGFVITDAGNIILNPTNGKGKVGIGTLTPSSKLAVNGLIESSAGGYKFPDGTVQKTAASATSGVCKQASLSAVLLTSKFADIRSIRITPPAPNGYFVLTFSGMASNLNRLSRTRITIYLTNSPNNARSYPGQVSFYQSSGAGYTLTIPFHATRVFPNTSTAAKTFYLHAGDNLNGGYKLYGMFIVQWFPGTMQ